jgi:hypothetical protein
VIGRTGLADEIRHAVDPLLLMQRVADEAMILLEAIDGVFVGFAEDAEWLRLECGSGTLKRETDNHIPRGEVSWGRLSDR